MARKHKQDEGFGDVGPGEVISPLSFQRTDEGSTDSLRDMRPIKGEYAPPADPLSHVPKGGQ